LEYVTEVTYAKPSEAHALPNRARFVEVGQRFYPLLKIRSGCTIYRPLLRYNKQDVVRIVRAASIPILSVPCRYASYRPKRMLERYYESMQLHFDYVRVLEFAKNNLEILPLKKYESMSDERFLKHTF
jgi:hypothetical protein